MGVHSQYLVSSYVTISVNVYIISSQAKVMFPSFFKYPPILAITFIFVPFFESFQRTNSFQPQSTVTRNSLSGVHVHMKMAHKDDTSNYSSETQTKIAIIGGGVAGLSCANYLSKHPSVSVTVFDTGRLRPGGRCSTRLPGDKPKHKNQNRDSILSQYVIDHAAQILTIPKSKQKSTSFEAFSKQVLEWEKANVIRKFPPESVIELQAPNGSAKNGNRNDKTASFEVKVLNGPKCVMYHGVEGMSSIPKALVSQAQKPKSSNESSSSYSNVNIRQDIWISPNNGVKFTGTKITNTKWSLQTNQNSFGTFDKIIIAHNGKCADRLMSSTPAKELHSLLQTKFSPSVPKWGGKQMTLNSIYSLTFAIKEDTSPINNVLSSNVICAFIKNQPNLRFLTCQSRKYPKSLKYQGEKLQVWTVLSSPQFAKSYKAPQENIPNEVQEEVTKILLSSLENSLCLEEDTLKKEIILDSKLQLWGAAVPLNTWCDLKIDETKFESSGFVYDAEHGVGICGDWLLDPSIAGAYESGRLLAEWIVDSENMSKSIGLPRTGCFRPSLGSGIGNIK